MRIVSAKEESLKFSDGSEIISDHCQDCCEYNYADFSVLEIDPELMENEFVGVAIGRVIEDEGFNLIFFGLPHKTLGTYNKTVFIPCYSCQNGYYSSDVEITFFNPDRTPKVEFSLCSELIY